MIHTTWSTTTSFSNNFNFQLHYLECEYSFFNGFRTASINNLINIITLPLDIIHVIIDVLYFAHFLLFQIAGDLSDACLEVGFKVAGGHSAALLLRARR